MTTVPDLDTTSDEYHQQGVWCGEAAHCVPPYPGALPGTPYTDGRTGHPDPAAATAACERMFTALGIVGDEHTPARHVRALLELTRGLAEDPTGHLAVTFPPVSAEPGLVVATDVPFVSLCAHHGLPFVGTFTVGYLPKPDSQIVGLSKLARMVLGYAARPQVQEAIAAQSVSALMNTLNARGAAIALRATHSCMAYRGARTGAASGMVTVEHDGELRQSPWRDEFTQAAARVIIGR